jgi:AraC-like DNA-binding protein
MVGGQTFRIESTSVLWVPAAAEMSLSVTSALWDALTLFPSVRYLGELAAENPLDPAALEALNSRVLSVKRSRWLDDIVERYFYERVVNPRTPAGCPSFLEKQILNELVRLLFPNCFPTRHGELVIEADDPARQALAYLEAHLFEDVSLEGILRHVGVTKQTLLAAFRNTFGVSPYAYAKQRRLDEALRLLERGEHQVADVARLVGYDDVSAFSKAMRSRFGKSPSEFYPEK